MFIVFQTNIKYLKLERKYPLNLKENIIVKEDIRIPKGFKIEINNGYKIRFLDGASYSYSPITVSGIPSQPVTFIGSPTSSILFLNTNILSDIKHANFQGFAK